MSAEFKITGTSAGAVKAVEDLSRMLDEAEKSADGVTKATKKMVTEAQRIKEANDPQAKYNRQIMELAQLCTKAGLSIDDAQARAVKYGLALERANNAGGKAFGADALRNVGAFASSITGISSALDLAVGAMRNFRQEQKQAADDALRSRMGIGQLSQLAASATDASGKITPASQDAAMKSLVAEADKALAMGAAGDRGQAASLVFDLNSAGLSPADRQFAAKLRAKGVLQDVAGLGQAFDASTTALGAAEVGTFEQFASKAIAAGAVSPGSIQALPTALTKAGADAKKLGMSDEFLLSAGAYLAKESGSPDEGGTKMAAMLAAMNKTGIDFKGMSGAQMIQRLSQENVGYGGVFKDNREAVNAFATVRDNLQSITSLEGNVSRAQSMGLAARALGLPNLDPSTFAANLRAEQEGVQAVVDEQTLSRGENLRQAAMAEWKARSRKQGAFGAEWDIAMAEVSAEFSTPAFHLQRGVNATDRDPTSLGAIQDPKLLAEIRDYLKDIAQSNRNVERTTYSKITTRQE